MKSSKMLSRFGPGGEQIGPIGWLRGAGGCWGGAGSVLGRAGAPLSLAPPVLPVLLSHAAGKENQLLVLVSSTSLGCAGGVSSWQPVFGLVWFGDAGGAPRFPARPWGQAVPQPPPPPCSAQEDDEGSQCSADFDLSLPDNGFMSKNDVIRSKVSRLTERLRKRYPSNNFGEAGGAHCWGRRSSGGLCWHLQQPPPHQGVFAPLLGRAGVVGSLQQAWGGPGSRALPEPALSVPGSCTGCGATFSVLKKRVSLRLLTAPASC